MVIGEMKAQVQATEAEQQYRLASLSQAAEGRTPQKGEVYNSDDTHGFRENILKTVERVWRQAKPYSFADSWTQVFDWAARQDRERVDCGFQNWRGPSLSLLQDLRPDELQELLTNEGLLRRFYGGPGTAALVDDLANYELSGKKLRTLEWSIAKLALKLLFHSTASSRSKESRSAGNNKRPSHTTGDALPNKSVSHVEANVGPMARAVTTTTPGNNNSEKESIPLDAAREGERSQPSVSRQDMEVRLMEERLAHIDSRLHELLLNTTNAADECFDNFESPPLPRFQRHMGPKPRRSDEAFELNNSLKPLLDPLMATDKQSEIISKICYNLLKSRTPPNVYTYNMLLTRFCHLDDYKMFRAVLTSMRESHIRPNELTHSTVLRYFTILGRGDFFMEYVLRLEGHLEGLALANDNKEIPSITRDRYHTFYRRGNKRKVAEKARMNGEVYEALISGALRFFGPRSAMQYYRDMISEGWKASTDLLIAILKSCYRRRDWYGGVSVWHQIKKISETANTTAFEWMLCLCQICGQQDAFERLLQDGVNAGALPSSMLALPDRIKNESLDKSCKGADISTALSGKEIASESSSVSWLEKHIRSCIGNQVMSEKAFPGIEPSLMDEEGPPARLVVRRSTVGTRDDMSVLHALNAKIWKLNQTDSHKMNREEFLGYRYSLWHWRKNNGQVVSRSWFEKFKIGVDSKLEREDREGRILSEPSTMETRNFYAPPGSLLSDESYLKRLVDVKSPMPRSKHFDSPSFSSEPDDSPPETPVEVDYVSRLLGNTSSMTTSESVQPSSSLDAVDQDPSKALASTNVYGAKISYHESSSPAPGPFPHPSSSSELGEPATKLYAEMHEETFPEYCIGMTRGQ